MAISRRDLKHLIDAATITLAQWEDDAAKFRVDLSLPSREKTMAPSWAKRRLAAAERRIERLRGVIDRIAAAADLPRR